MPRALLVGALAALSLGSSGDGAGEDGPAARRGGRVETVVHRRGDMVRVPAGSFTMGFPAEEEPTHDAVDRCQQAVGGGGPLWCSQQAQSAGWLDPLDVYKLTYLTPHLNAVPERLVYLPAFEIDRHEVTVADYRRCVRAGVCDSGPLLQGDQRQHEQARNPITNVTWRDAADYCAFAGKRLPTEAEWEKAARGDDGRVWPWGRQERRDGGNFGRMVAEAVRRTHAMQPGRSVSTGDDATFEVAPDGADGALYAVPPGTMRWSESRFGAVDMAGNVAEWVADYFGQFGYGDLAADAPHRRVPLDRDTRRVVRGGSFLDLPLAGRTYARSSAPPDTRSPLIGFRCARDA